jgi:predicted transcriptional regulator
VVRQIKDGRAYRYAPVQSRAEMTAALMMDALSGTPDQDAALAHFVGALPPEALQAALEAINQNAALEAINQNAALEANQQER